MHVANDVQILVPALLSTAAAFLIAALNIGQEPRSTTKSDASDLRTTIAKLAGQVTTPMSWFEVCHDTT